MVEPAGSISTDVTSSHRLDHETWSNIFNFLSTVMVRKSLVWNISLRQFETTSSCLPQPAQSGLQVQAQANGLQANDAKVLQLVYPPSRKTVRDTSLFFYCVFLFSLTSPRSTQNKWAQAFLLCKIQRKTRCSKKILMASGLADGRWWNKQKQWSDHLLLALFFFSVPLSRHHQKKKERESLFLQFADKWLCFASNTAWPSNSL